MTLDVRWLPFRVADGPWQMAADEAMLDQAIDGTACFRLYGWNPPTLSLGYFQRHRDRLADPTVRHLAWVRRATGGGAIVHDGDLTYAVALPPDVRQQRSPADWQHYLHRALARLMAGVVPVQVVEGDRPAKTDLPFLCFAEPQPGDLAVGGRKIAGSAQRLRRGALLQHGSIHWPTTTADPHPIARRLAELLDWRLIPEPWNDHWERTIQRLIETRYGTRSWNEKR